MRRFHAQLLLCVLLPLAAGGCGGFDRLPKLRIGSAPYPRTNSYLAALDPADLGPHRYDSFVPRLDAEKSRGEVYTCRGGFIDLSHARHVSDWSRHMARWARIQIRKGRDHYRVEATDHSSVEVDLHYPDWWQTLPAAERDDLTNALAMRIGQKAAYALQVYHELQTWYGYRYVPIWDEWDSAFCYDDMISHLVGVRTAAAALGDGRRLDMNVNDYNKAMEIAYAAEMRRLGGVTPERTWQAIYSLEGEWWGEDVPVKRQVDAGYGDGVLEAWTIPGFCAEGSPPPFDFALPDLADVRGRDMRGFAAIYVLPGTFQRGRMSRALGGESARRLDIDRDFPRLVQAAAADARRRLGAEAVSPPATVSTTRPAQVLPADGGDAIRAR